MGEEREGVGSVGYQGTVVEIIRAHLPIAS